MTDKKTRLKRPSNAATSSQADTFINEATDTKKPLKLVGQKVARNIKFDPELLERIDAEAKRRGISRNAFISQCCALALDAR